MACRVKAYAESVVRGKTPACKWVKLACERHLRDVNRSDFAFKFDEKVADTAIRSFTSLAHYKGEWAGQPFVLEPWQAFIVGSVFGWLRKSDDMRRFRVAYNELPRKNGKSAVAAGVAIKLAFGDGEPGAEVYCAATKRDQAKIVFGDAKRMVMASKGLRARIGVFTNNLHSTKTNSKLEPLGADADTMDGLNIHGAIIDELHAHKTRAMVDVIETATGARRQPLEFDITTAGFDRHSVCWERHDYSCKVLEELIEDDTWFAFIATLDGPFSTSFQSLSAVQRLDILCSCNHAPTIQTARLFVEECAERAIVVGIVSPALSDVRPTRTARFGHEECAEPAMKGGSCQSTPPTGSVDLSTSPSGQQRTGIKQEQPTSDIKIDTRLPSPRQSGSGSSDSHLTTLPPSEASKTIDVLSASSKKIYASITATLQAKFGDSFADNATVRLVCSETLRRAYKQHSATCNTRKAQLNGDTLTVHFEGDDWRDPATWAKANPNLGVSVKLDDLKRKCEKAINLPGAQNAFKRLHLNVWTEVADRWIDVEAWDACGEPVEYAELIGRPCFAGLDLSSTQDVTALTYVFPPVDEDEKWKVFCRFFVPKDNIRKRAEKDRVPYDVWATQGFVEPTEGNVVDYDAVKLAIIEDASRFQLQELAYDRFNATKLITELQGEGITVVPFGQGFVSMSAPTKELEKLVISKNISHGGNPVLRWMASNVTVRQDPAGNLKPDKAKSSEKIDGIVAICMALGRAMTQETQGASVYETEGITFL